MLRSFYGPQPMSNFSLTPKNRLLAGLSQEDLALLTPHMQRVEFEQRIVLYDVGSPLDHVYFMEQGVASIITMMENGASIEVGMIGLEGMVSVSAMLGDKVSKHHVVSSFRPWRSKSIPRGVKRHSTKVRAFVINFCISPALF